MDWEHVNAKISEVQEKYSNLKKSIIEEINKLKSPEEQFGIVDSDLNSFINQVNSQINKLPDDQAHIKLDVLASCINEIKDFISDRPSVIKFQLEKYQAMVSLLEDFESTGENLKKGFANREKRLDKIESDLKSGKDPSKRRRPGTRVEKIKDVRIANARKKTGNKKKPTKKRTKKSASK